MRIESNLIYSLKLVKVLNAHGDIHRKIESYEKAIDLYKQALSILEDYYGNILVPEASPILNNLGVSMINNLLSDESKSKLMLLIDDREEEV